MLLVLAFDVAFAGLLVPLVFGIYKPDIATTPAALSGMLTGSLTRLIFFVLVPTTYGIPNTLLFVQNDIFTSAFDGLPTFIAPLVGLAVFLGVAYATKDTYGTRTLDREGRRTVVAAGSDDEE
jgi:Na+(H+)/acetate symporter ActP